MWSILYYLRNDPDKLRWNLRARGMDDSVVDEAIALDVRWREEQKKLDALRHERNKLTKEIPRLSGEERRRAVERARELSRRIADMEREVEEVKRRRDEILLSMPNVMHESVPVGESEEDNVAVVDTLRAGKVAGSRFYYMYSDLVWLDFALSLYAMEYLVKQGFIPVYPPLMLNRRAYEGVTTLADFEEMLYKIDGDDLFLIATSEHPIAALFMNEVLETEELPLKFVGYSPCFRKEAGAHGKDTKGIFRVHNFNKVEQFVFCLPEESWDWHERLIRNAEELFRGLGIPYRVVNICSGELGDVAAKRYDLEVWMPAQGRYREAVSCSNCLDWQSYRLNIRYAKKRGMPTEGYVHTLNSTAIATSRAITAILENFQEPDGTVKIPKVLRKYLEHIDGAPTDEIRPVRILRG
ncbi:serine--tRNA ligase [Candidatus Geothermarchaeota archaeon ex4572_27]|nr:MAG: serine--tRNA ligase [Candidatus Geothermarchaeota archaeon ex4572_27]